MLTMMICESAHSKKTRIETMPQALDALAAV